MTKLSPELHVAKHGLENTFLQFFKQVKQEIFPLDNIAFNLWVEVVRWYSAGMRYMGESKKV